MLRSFCILTITLIACSGHHAEKEITANSQKLADKELNLANSQQDTSGHVTGRENLYLNNYHWAKLLDSAPWKKSYNFQMFSFRDTIWTFHPDGNWFSIDGIRWTKSSLPNAIYNLAFLDYILFNDVMYGLGHFEGNIERFRLRPEIYYTGNMKQWDSIGGPGNLPQRFFYHPFVFKNMIWIIGGEDRNTKYNDIWNSPDAIHWTKQKDNVDAAKNGGSQVVMLKGKLYLLNNEVWSSTDGLNWQKETSEIVKGQEIFGYSAQVMDNKIWLLGCNRNGQFTSQVLVSADGKHWEGMDAPWSPRGGIAATVHRGKIYMTGGKYGGTPDMPDFRYSNDVWVLGSNGSQ
jgi:hypothetical protein